MEEFYLPVLATPRGEMEGCDMLGVQATLPWFLADDWDIKAEVFNEGLSCRPVSGSEQTVG